MPKYVLSLLVKRKLKNLLSVLRYRLPQFRGRRQNQHIASYLPTSLKRSKSINQTIKFRFVVHSEARTRLDNLTKIQSSNAWISSWNVQMLHFPLCWESVLGMPRIEIVQYGLLFWHTFGTVCCFFHSKIYHQQIAWPVESDCPINIVFVRSSVLSLFNWSCHMTKMAAMPIYGENLKKNSSLEPKC